MTDTTPQRPAGWDALFQNKTFPPRYQTTAAPNESVGEWAATLAPHSTVLDVGCGVGRHVMYLGGLGFRVSGSDIAPSGVEATRIACEERGISFEGKVADMIALPWEDNTFDAAFSTATICHHRRADIVKALAEIWRVVKPGGTVLIDFLHKYTQSYKDVLAQVAAGKLAQIEPNTFVDNSDAPDLGDDAFLPHYYTDEADVRALMSGFERLNVYADLPLAADNALPKRGYWVAIGYKPTA